MNIEEFEKVVGNIYDELPEEIKNKFTLSIEEFPTEGSKKLHPFGYWLSLCPTNYILCYWVFKETNNFDIDHIKRVMKHEFEHVLFGLKHSEHK